MNAWIRVRVLLPSVVVFIGVIYLLLGYVREKQTTLALAPAIASSAALSAVPRASRLPLPVRVSVSTLARASEGPVEAPANPNDVVSAWGNTERCETVVKRVFEKARIDRSSVGESTCGLWGTRAPALDSGSLEYERVLQRLEAEQQEHLDRALLYASLYLLRFSQAERLGQRLHALRTLRELCHAWQHALRLGNLGAIPLITQALEDPNALIRREAAYVLASASQNHYEFQQFVRPTAPELLRHAADSTEWLPVRSACLHAALAMVENYRHDYGESTTDSALRIFEEALEICSKLCTAAVHERADMNRFVRRSITFIRYLLCISSRSGDESGSTLFLRAFDQYAERHAVRHRLEQTLRSACVASDARLELSALMQVLRSTRMPALPDAAMLNTLAGRGEFTG